MLTYIADVPASKQYSLPNIGVMKHPACCLHQADEPEQISIIWPVIAAWRCLLYFRLSFFFKSFALSEALLMAFIRAASSHAKDSCRALRRVEFKYRGNKASIICTGSCSKIRLLSKSLVSVLTCSTLLTPDQGGVHSIKQAHSSFCFGTCNIADCSRTIPTTAACQLHWHAKCKAF